MVQALLPESDLHVGAWKNEAGEVSDLFDSINIEEFSNNFSFAESEIFPLSSPYATKLSSGLDPGVGTGHILHLDIGKHPINGRQIDLTVEIRQGYVSEASPGTLIHSFSLTDVAALIQGGSSVVDLTLPSGSADLVSDYTDLSVRFLADQC